MRDTLLFTTGYIPEFHDYPGAKNPQPIMLRHELGDSTRETICEEIMALTKLNWNSSAYGSDLPAFFGPLRT
jgi:argonaute-like protein implicated in RNA metabolism and viral defense